MSVGLALSGGGVKGAYHIGVIKALIEEGIDIEYISGTSCGAIVAALFANGILPDEMLKIFNCYARKIVYFDNKSMIRSVLNIKNGSSCINKYDNFEGVLKSIFKTKDIKDVSTKLAICTVDINTGETIYFHNGNEIEKCIDGICENSGLLYKIIRASAAYPVLFEPSYYKGRVLVDGGVKKNLPVSILKSMGAEKIIAVDVSKNILPLKSMSMLNVGFKCIEIMGMCNNEKERKQSDFLIKPKNINHIGLLDFEYINALATEGYYSTKKNIDKIKCI